MPAPTPAELQTWWNATLKTLVDNKVADVVTNNGLTADQARGVVAVAVIKCVRADQRNA